MSALPIRKTGNSNSLAAIARAQGAKLKIKRSDDSDITPQASFEDLARANFPDNPRAQELEVKLRKRTATKEEITELGEIIRRDSERLTDILCQRIVDGIFKSRKK